jgi:hypothetical protein
MTFTTRITKSKSRLGSKIEFIEHHVSGAETCQDSTIMRDKALSPYLIGRRMVAQVIIHTDGN